MSALENQAAETSKDADDRKVDCPWNIIHIRLPPRKRLSDASVILGKKVPGNTSNTRSKEVPEPITDNPGKNPITAPVQGEANRNSPRARLCNAANSNIMSKSLSAESESDTSGNKLLDGANVSSLSKNLIVAAEEQGSGARSYTAKHGLSEEANNNNASMILPLPVQELPEDNIDSSPSKNLATIGKQGEEEERNNSPRKKLLYNTDSKLADEKGNSPSWNITITAVKYEEVFEGANHPIPTKLSDEVKNNAPSIRPTDLAIKSTPHKSPCTSSVQATGTSQNTPGMNLSASVGQAVEQSTNAANMEVIKVYEVFEEKIQRNVYLDNFSHQTIEAKTNTSRTLSTTAIECQVFEHANHLISTKKLSDVARINSPSNRPTDPAMKSTPRKKPHISAVQITGRSQNTYIKRTVYLGNLSHQATEAKTNPSRMLSMTAIDCEVSEHANHPIPTKYLSDVARNKFPSNRPTNPAKKSTPRKKPCTSPVQYTGTSQKTSTMKIFTSDGQAVNRSKIAADLEAVKQYEEFEEKVKRTVYLDNLSHQATEAVIKAALSQFCTIRKVSFVVNYTIPYNIPQSALVEMETEKDAEVVVSMLHDFPFMMSGMPRPLRAIHAIAEMFNDRPRRPGSKLKFCWVKNTDPNYAMVKRLKLLSRKHEVENLALIEHELEEEKLLAAKQRENLNVNYMMMETMDSVLLSGMSNDLSNIYNVSWNDVF